MWEHFIPRVGIIANINSNNLMTFEEILNNKLAEGVPVKGQPGKTVMPIEAMVNAIMAKAIKGDIPSIVFINNMTQKPTEETEEEKVKQRLQLELTKQEITDDLESEGLTVTNHLEIENLARQQMTLRRIAKQMDRKDYNDIDSQTQKDGTIKLQLSTVNRIYSDLLKDFRADFKAYRVQLIQQKLQNKK